MKKSRERHYMEYGSVYLASKASMHWRTKPKFVGRRRRGKRRGREEEGKKSISDNAPAHVWLYV